MSGEPLIPRLPAGVPDDWVQRRDVACPTCRYNLRMLHVPRCPECGSVFRWQQLLRVYCPRCDTSLFETNGERCPRCNLVLDWPALLDSAAVLDRRLYEYSNHPRRAALRTFVAVLSPWSFWRRVRLEMPPVAERLRRLQWTTLITAAVGAGLIGLSPLWISRATLERQVLGPLAMALTLPLLTALALPRFTPTLARFRIRADQLRRCLAYASSGAFWLGVCFLGGFVFAWLANTSWIARPLGIRTTIAFFPDHGLLELVTPRGLGLFFNPWLKWFNRVLMFSWALFGLLWWWAFLYVALRRYLRLDGRNALALFASTQVMGILLLTFLLLQLHVATMALGELQLRLGAWIRHLGAA